MEALCLVDMINQHIIPAVKEAGVWPLAELESDVQILRRAITGLHDAKTSYEWKVGACFAFGNNGRYS